MPIFPTWYTQKNSPALADKILISDSEASNQTKYIEITDLPFPAVEEAKFAFKTSVTVWFSNADYICDGTADNVEINLAIATVWALWGWEIIIKEWNYNLSAWIVIAVDNITITWLPWNNISTTNSIRAFSLIKSWNAQIENTIIQWVQIDWCNIAIYSVNWYNTKYRNNRMYNCYLQWINAYDTHCEIAYNLIDTVTTEFWIVVTWQEDFKIYWNILLNCFQWIEIWYPVKKVKVYDNYTYNTTRYWFCILLHELVWSPLTAVTDVEVYNNIFEDNWRMWIRIEITTVWFTIDNINIHWNTILWCVDGTWWYGIDVYDWNNVQISNNYCENFALWWIRSRWTWTIITWNLVNSSISWSNWIEAAMSDWVITNNAIKNCTIWLYWFTTAINNFYLWNTFENVTAEYWWIHDEDKLIELVSNDLTWLYRLKFQRSDSTQICGITGRSNWVGININDTERFFINSTWRVWIWEASPTAMLHLKAWTATASTAPLKLTSGTNLATPENWAFEYDWTNLYFTTWWVRKTVTLV